MPSQPYLNPSILDRLIDRQPQHAAEPVQDRFATAATVTESVLRDLENLFNARRRIRTISRTNRQAASSLLCYGTGDFICRNPRSYAVQGQIRSEIERLVQLFEPRLKNVTVRLDPAAARERSLHFRIDAVLLGEPASTPITFDTCFDINSGTYSITK